MFSRMGSAAFKKDLTNTITLCEYLDNPQKKFISIHVGGTNGKGSVSHMLAAVLHENGYKTGLYTSPHLFDFRERIKINGDFITEAFVIDFVERIKPLIEKIEPSFFEITVAMAFEYFVQQEVDLAIIEVGLGGRLDSTNIITPELSVITNIGWDHMNMLGNSLEEIAAEKGGIIKRHIPVVIGERTPETQNIFIDIARQKQAPIYFAEDHFMVKNFQWKNNQLQISVDAVADKKTIEYFLDLPGIYQTKNLCTVLQSIDLLKNKFSLNDEKIKSALAQVKIKTGFFGRWEVVSEKPKMVLDVAHNQEGIKEVLRQLEKEDFDKLHIVIGIVKDKEINNILNLLPKEATYYFTQAAIPRALPAAELKQKANRSKLIGEEYENVNEAIKAAKEKTSNRDFMLVCGSIFLIAEVEIETSITSQ